MTRPSGYLDPSPVTVIYDDVADIPSSLPSTITTTSHIEKKEGQSSAFIPRTGGLGDWDDRPLGSVQIPQVILNSLPLSLIYQV